MEIKLSMDHLVECLIDDEDPELTRKWSTQSRERHRGINTKMLDNYRMSNIIAGVVRGQFPYLEEHIAQKKAIYQRYKEGIKDLPVSMNPYDEVNSEPNFWLSCLLLNEDAMCEQIRTDLNTTYKSEAGKTCPDEILETLAKYNAEGRPIWKPMHLQPIYKDYAFVSVNGDTSADIFQRGLCLPSDNKMTIKEQEQIIEIVRGCFY